MKKLLIALFAGAMIIGLPGCCGEKCDYKKCEKPCKTECKTPCEKKCAPACEKKVCRTKSCSTGGCSKSSYTIKSTGRTTVTHTTEPMKESGKKTKKMKKTDGSMPTEVKTMDAETASPMTDMKHSM